MVVVALAPLWYVRGGQREWHVNGYANDTGDWVGDVGSYGYYSTKTVDYNRELAASLAIYLGSSINLASFSYRAGGLGDSEIVLTTSLRCLHQP